jgi:hypothetical protein
MVGSLLFKIELRLKLWPSNDPTWGFEDVKLEDPPKSKIERVSTGNPVDLVPQSWHPRCVKMLNLSKFYVSWDAVGPCGDNRAEILELNRSSQWTSVCPPDMSGGRLNMIGTWIFDKTCMILRVWGQIFTETPCRKIQVKLLWNVWQEWGMCFLLSIQNRMTIPDTVTFIFLKVAQPPDDTCFPFLEKSEQEGTICWNDYVVRICRGLPRWGWASSHLCAWGGRPMT